MSREELEREARRIGVIAPERLGRHALERRIREHHASPLRRARRAFRGLVGFAKAIAGAPPSLPRPEPETRTTESSPPTTEADNRPPTADADHRPPTPTADADHREPTPKDESRPPTPKADSRPPTPKADSRPPTPTADNREPTPKAEHREPTPTADAETPKPEIEEIPGEPIPTRTMARLLADQGHTRRALAIYKKLLRETPADEDLRKEVDRLESSARSRGTKSASDAGDADDDESEGVEVIALPVGQSRVLIAWSVAGPALAAAEAMLDDPADLEARVVVVRADSNGAIRREVRERPAEPAGEWVVPVYAGARVTAAVGLNQGGRFVSVAHAPVVIA
ncbi:MAG: hypothetical protein JJ863_14640 [Deltaproteobacteria bacterium]|nr:hypothetical protein [Deltaproteobacteria bacterium]